MAKRRKRSTRRQSRLASMFIIVAVVVVCTASLFKISDLYNESRELTYTEETLEKKLEQTVLDRQELEAREQYMKTKQYIEDVAKEKLGLVYPDEIVIRPEE